VNWKITQWRSLNTRVTSFTLIIFVVSIWSLAFYATRTLRIDMERQLGEQQFSTASIVAANINWELDYRLRALEAVATGVRPTLLGNPAALQIHLEEHLGHLQMFNAGTFVTGIDGRAIASIPISLGRIGVNYLDRDYVIAALKEGKSAIGKPVIGKALKSPVFGMAAPIRDDHGKVIGALMGVTDLGQPSFLDKITENTYGKTGGYLLVAPQHKLIVTGTDKSRIMTATPAPGINPLFDRVVQGFEGSGSTVDSRGLAVFAAAKQIPVAGWLLFARIPAEEAFKPIHAMEQRMLLAAAFLTLLAGVLTWWMLRRQLAPMLATSKLLATLSATNLPPQPLPITRQDEIGDLIGGFNQLLETLKQRNTELQESESRWKFAIDGSGDGLWDWHVPPSTVFFSPRWKEMLGFAPDEIGSGLDEWSNRVHPDDLVRVMADVQAHLDGTTPHYINEHRVSCKDGTYKWILDRGMVVERDAANKPLRVIGTHTDITERKLAETKLQLAASVFSHTRESITITDAVGTIIDVNEAFTRITGYLREDAMGQNSRILSSGRQDKSFYTAMWIALTEQGYWSGEIWNRRKDGEVYAIEIAISAVKDATGAVQQYMALSSDITERKNLEEQVRQMAFFDPLTKIPNRRLLGDRLSQAMSASKRSSNYGALMMLDLDNFKPLNDTHGHLAGDLLLIEVARRLTECVRGADTVVRLGGDEFVVMLGELDADKAESAKQAAEVAEKIRTSLALPYRLTAGDEGPAGSEVEHRCTASIGVALFLNHQTSQTDILKQADAAMYQAKEAGRNGVRFYG
jgi:diguanylate cyclase (GGDEF)-like protein/PAS domain S-box-containing protein